MNWPADRPSGSWRSQFFFGNDQDSVAPVERSRGGDWLCDRSIIDAFDIAIDRIDLSGERRGVMLGEDHREGPGMDKTSETIDRHQTSFARTFLPITQANHPTGEMYHDPAVLEREKQVIFGQDWLCIGRA